MNKVKIINTYWKLKKVHDLLSNGDWNDPRTELIKESISIEEMDRINEILTPRMVMVCAPLGPSNFRANPAIKPPNRGARTIIRQRWGIMFNPSTYLIF